MAEKLSATRLIQIAVGALACSAIFLTGCAERKILTGVAHPHQNKAERSVQAEILGNSAEVWFVKPGTDNIELVKVSRKLVGRNKLEAALTELLRGPTGEEEAQGLASEIPKGTILLGVKPLDDDYEIDLSRRFNSGGGEASMQTRMEQLKRTVASVAGDKKVYLNVEGKRLVAAAEGLEVQQPINF
jgi:spore germination protein GerM